MKLMLDTHIFLWAIAQPEKLSSARLLLLEQLSNEVYVSAVTIAELMIKQSLGKLAINFNPIDEITKCNFELLNFTAHDARWLAEMPFYHKDPFDRMLIAQALENNYTLMTDDMMFRQYDCKLI